ncbi:hypothetical protein EU244_012750 [Rhodococcus qingshengii]|uniref:hypothetical protein n=1 Tax=Rhodococcus qingshengii TaxID=334542 RepID=UPI0010A674A9|nr:hypothetical protein [Rhodococcus qingshengii]THJ69970.1 hypothetical protein EU244_20135 [Rhodococcus qingshengii]
MTAPDPGLTDLIAAHTLRVVELNEAVRYPECNGCDWVGGLVKEHAAHVASLSAQHFSGRMAANLGGDPQDYDIAWAAKRRWQERAEKAEATIARVEKLAHDMRGWCSPHGISVTYSDRICAVLEGE